MRPTTWILPCLGVLLLCGCQKSVHWEEEVPLNTGETIWVKRITTRSLQGAGGNPLDLGMRPDWKETLVFSYAGKTFKYTGEANLLVLAISKSGSPILVAPASDKGWDYKHGFKCTVPHYVQLVPDAAGASWSWPRKIDSWLYELPANLMIARTSLPPYKNKYTKEDRDMLDRALRVGAPKYQRIDSRFLSEGCVKEETGSRE